MKIGLYFGTFNPIHIGHLVIANHMAEFSSLDQVWFVVTPHNPLKDKSTLLEDYKRLELVHLATEDYPKLRASDVEFKLPQPNYTVNTLIHLEEKFRDHDFSLIMGEDNLKSLRKWKNYEMILEHYPIHVYPRISGQEMPALESKAGIYRTDAPIMEISSTFIRNAIRIGKNIRPLLPEKVWRYVDENNLYKRPKA